MTQEVPEETELIGRPERELERRAVMGAREIEVVELEILARARHRFVTAEPQIIQAGKVEHTVEAQRELGEPVPRVIALCPSPTDIDPRVRQASREPARPTHGQLTPKGYTSRIGR